MRDRILIAEDEVDLLQGLGRMIAYEIECDIDLAENGRQALAIMAEKPVDLLLTDVRMPDMDGMELFRSCLEINPYLTVVVMTAYGSIEQAVEAIKAGAFDFITKPFDEKQLISLIREGLDRNRPARENRRRSLELATGQPFQEMIGTSPAMIEVFESIQMLCRTDVTVLISGESGTGKEMAARAIHRLSPRGERRMITVNCPALPENILESELFGYRKGAFTNALADRKGLFAEAHGSTIFLDEIGDLSPVLQTKLLRVLQEKEIRPLGDTRSHRVDVRIIASTNRDLPGKIEEGGFRQDLFYRLNVASLVMPPLRNRREDIPLLVDHFLKKAAASLKVPPKTITSGAMNYLLTRQWPGNIRELENMIQGFTALVSHESIDVPDLPGGPGQEPLDMGSTDLDRPYKELKDRMLENFTTVYVQNLLQKTGGNVSLAAKLSQIKRQSLQKIIKRYGIDPDQYRK